MMALRKTDRKTKTFEHVTSLSKCH